MTVLTKKLLTQPQLNVLVRMYLRSTTRLHRTTDLGCDVKLLSKLVRMGYAVNGRPKPNGSHAWSAKLTAVGRREAKALLHRGEP
jgi:hypothetical protein